MAEGASVSSATTRVYVGDGNALFHRKERQRSLAQEYGHSLLFLPPYSPDFNTIEHDFALKKRWAYSPHGTVLDDIVTTDKLA
ncbi:MAG: transposase [Cyanobacteria bacterium P01_E01_bin.34]